MGATYPPLLDGGTATDREFWLGAANQAVRAYCGWHVAPIVQEHLIVDGTGTRTLLLPTKRIVELVSVVDHGGDYRLVDSRRELLDEVAWSHSSGVIERLHPDLWSRRLGGIDVELRHGYDPADVPDVLGVVASVASRAAAMPAGVVSQSVGSASVRYATDHFGQPWTIPLLSSERDALAPYRLNWGA